MEGASPVLSYFTASIGLGSREHLLQESADLDEKRARWAREHGQHLFEVAQLHLDQLGIVHPKWLQWHGHLVDSHKAMKDDIRLLVIGRQDKHGESVLEPIGGDVENVIRTRHRPVLVVLLTTLSDRLRRQRQRPSCGCVPSTAPTARRSQLPSSDGCRAIGRTSGAT
ncbi:hypothetical protein [Xylella taiwanensis]|nr:hypothetical protein [Xylella taiwanensis]MCD8463483.1 hypothetical protein [Xylella taiwanensis]